LWPAFAALTLPALLALALLLWMRYRVPDPSVFEPLVLDPVPAQPSSPEPPAGSPASARGGLPVTFLLFSASTALTTFGLVGFGLISFHLNDSSLVTLAAVPLVYALGMAAGAVAALASGRAYDRVGATVLLVVPLLAAGVPALSLAGSLAPVLVGVVLWGAATGIQDSTVKALVADLVASKRRGTAFGIFAVFQGAGTFAGAALAGALYPDAALLSLITVPAQVLAFALLLIVTRRRR
jgi:predicted MFS family arabinose efflux permease